MSDPWRIVAGLLPAVLLSAVCAAACAWAGGAQLNTFIAAFIVSTLIAPPLAAAEAGWRRRLLAAAAVWAPMAIAFWFCGRAADLHLVEIVQCAALLGAYLAALAALVAVMLRWRLAPVAAGALVVVLGLSWLTWPIWLAPRLDGRAAQALINGLVPLHPLLALDGVVSGPLGVWTEFSPLAYHLTNLNHDIPIALPRAAAAIGFCGAVAILGFYFSARSMNQMDAMANAARKT